MQIWKFQKKNEGTLTYRNLCSSWNCFSIFSFSTFFNGSALHREQDVSHWKLFRFYKVSSFLEHIPYATHILVYISKKLLGPANATVTIKPSEWIIIVRIVGVFLLQLKDAMTVCMTCITELTKRSTNKDCSINMKTECLTYCTP